MTSSTAVEGHFAFGENWKSFAGLVDQGRIEQAEAGMQRLFPDSELKGTRFLDIGCGSGLSSLAALRLGAASVDAIDIDPASVETTRQTLGRHAASNRWTARVLNVFDLPGALDAPYDVVYSWGVLHHTGDMWRAVASAASMVKPGGLFAIALYRKTRWCEFWTREKKFYSSAMPVTQATVRGIYKTLQVLQMLRGRINPFRRIRDYRERGMSWSHDVHDWLGGYPYESAASDEVRHRLHALGFEIVRDFVSNPAGGILGSGCDEFVAKRSVT